MRTTFRLAVFPLVPLIRYSVDLNNSRFGVPLTFPLITLVVALELIQLTIVEEETLPAVAL